MAVRLDLVDLLEKRCYYMNMTGLQLITKNKKLLQAFKEYQKRYLSLGKKPNITNLLSDDVYHTMRLEGEKVTKKQVQVLFKN